MVFKVFRMSSKAIMEALFLYLADINLKGVKSLMKKSILSIISSFIVMAMVFTLGATNVCAAQQPVLEVFFDESAMINCGEFEKTSFEACADIGNEPVAAHVEVTEEEVIEVARVLEHECCGFGDEGRYLIATVIANRVVSPHYPDDLMEVVLQKGQLGDGKGKYPCSDCIAAARAVFEDDVRALPAYILNFQSIRKDYWEEAGYQPYCQINQGRYHEYFCFKPEYRDEVLESLTK